MKFKYLIIFILFFYSCSNISAGSFGAYKINVFPITQHQLTIALDRLYLKYPKYIVPKKWKYESEYWERNHLDSLKASLLYFKNKYEEMYYITYIDPGFGTENPSNIRIAIRAVYNKNTGWQEIKKYNSKERIRIEKRFEDEIIIRLERLTNTKSFFEKTYP